MQPGLVRLPLAFSCPRYICPHFRSARMLDLCGLAFGLDFLSFDVKRIPI
jgi:hypothetical protein